MRTVRYPSVRPRKSVTEKIALREYKIGQMSGLYGNGPVRMIGLEAFEIAGFRKKTEGIKRIGSCC
jgi:hypothetical protein